MNSVKNLQINTNATSRNKKRKLRPAIALFLATVGLTSCIAACNAKNSSNQTDNIVGYYDENTVERKIMDYLSISDQLHELYLNEYKIEESLYTKYNISNELKSPEELVALISKLKTVKNFIDSRDIIQQSENLELVLNLKRQEKLVNDYIYTTGYSVAHSNVTEATKKYAGETFGINNYNDINFKYNTSDGEQSVLISDSTNQYDKKSYNIDTWFSKDQEDKIIDGVKSMADTDISEDTNLADNEQYNRDRNMRIMEALKQSAILEKQVADFDLYDEGLSNKLR